jgi:ubiquinone/menaquinone biosynthesis C-methylase UbiE
MRKAFEWSPEVWKSFVERARVRPRVRDQTEAILRIVERIRPERILDAGCGYGRVSLELAERFPESEIVAVDQSHSMVEELVNAKGQKRIRVVRGDLEHLPLESGVVDLVLCLGVIMHVRNEHAAISEFVRVLGNRGTLLLTYNNCLNPFSVIFMITAAMTRAAGYKQSFHLRRFYERFLSERGYRVDAFPTHIVPAFPWPGPLKALLDLDLSAAEFGYEPILECQPET